MATAIGLVFWAFCLTLLVRENWDGDLRGLALFDARRPATTELLRQVPKHRSGYDGQFYSILATDPLFLDPATTEAIDNPTFRGRRVLLSLAAWILSGFGESRAAVVYILLTWLGALASIIITGCWLISIGASPLWTLALWLNVGIFVGVTRVLVDPAATAFVLLAVVTWERRGFSLAPWVAAAAALTRETALLVAPAMAVDAWRSGRRRDAVAAVAIPCGLLGGWMAYLGLHLARLPQIGRTNLWWPFGWLPGRFERLRSAPSRLLVTIESFSTLALLCSIALAATLVVAFWRTRRWPGPAELAFLAFTTLAIVLSPKVYSSFNHFTRILLPLPFLALVIGETLGAGWSRRLGRAAVLFGLAAGAFASIRALA
ncbi:MAG: hypothetical protein VYE73_11300 [Acidobacteriota bacterium]|nr:hypothetical protein [Acidobacteriota bacterium]